MAQPAKRRRRNIVEASDDEDSPKPQANGNTLANFLVPSPQSKAKSLPASTLKSPLRPRGGSYSGSTIKLPARGRRQQDGVVLASSSPNASPEKPKSRATKRIKTEEKGRTADLVALFSNQAQRARAMPVDNISDPISEDDGNYKTSSSSVVGQAARRRLRDGTFPTAPPSSTPLSAPPSQMFLKPPRSSCAERPNPPDDDDDGDDDNGLRPWSERFGPANLDELAVHKRKVADVRRWIEEVLHGRVRQRLLVLKGSAGTGKTTTVRLLARDLGCELVEWKNPVGALGGGLAGGGLSMGARFEDFLGIRSKFGVLVTDMDDDTTQTPRSGLRKVFLVEEFPNTFMRSSAALKTFRGTILGFLASTTAPRLGRRQAPEDLGSPVIMIVSESLLTTASATADSFTAHRLLGPEILRHPGTGVIEFNAIAPSLLSKALELIVQKEACKSGRRHTPGPLVLRRLGEIGDIRNAVASLEFLCVKGDKEADWGSRVSFAKRKRGASKQAVSMTKDEKESLELISQREASLGIFHAVGKVVYNKREEEAQPGEKAEELPRYLRRHSRPRRSLVSVDSLADETGTDTHTFISALYENYALSCEANEAAGPSSSLDYLNGCIEYLSECDILCPAWDGFFGGKGLAGGLGVKDSASHLLRQDEMAFQVAVRGLLFALPSPVRRKTAGSGRAGGGDTFRMFYPTSIKLWREKEELEGLVDMWSATLLRGDETASRQRTMTDGAKTFLRPTTAATTTTATKMTTMGGWEKDDKPEAGPAPLFSLGSAARRELVLERLPYVAHIRRARKSVPASAFRLRDLERVVSFRGIGPPTEDEAPDDEGDGLQEEEEAGGVAQQMGDAWATDRPEEGASPRKRRVGIRTRGDAGGSLAGLVRQKLVVSDDDIEDEDAT